MQEHLNTIIENIFFPTTILLFILCLFILISTYYILYIHLHKIFFKECNIPVSNIFADQYGMYSHWFIIFIFSVAGVLITYLTTTIMLIEGLTLNIFPAINWIIISVILAIIGIQLIWKALNCLFEHLTKSIDK